MRIFHCSCGESLYFDNVRCLKCRHDVGWCQACQQISDVLANNPADFTCTSCGAHLVRCGNWAYDVCNRFVVVAAVSDAAPAGGEAGETANPLCDCCRFNKTIPDLKVEGNKAKWSRLEAAKRRTLYDLGMLGLRYGNAQDGVAPALAFEFKADVVPSQIYRSMDGGEKVFTGHDNGVITINIQEADDVVREKLRVGMHEPQRSLLGHFRHEFGHYIWDVSVKGSREAESIEVFGDHNNPTYGDALKAYYEKGPKPDWLLTYVSAYSTMHAWEDYAETFAVYLDMASALDTAYHNGLIDEMKLEDLDWMIAAYQRLGIALNEMNRSNGLLDYLPEVIAPPIKRKLAFIHGLCRPVRQLV